MKGVGWREGEWAGVEGCGWAWRGVGLGWGGGSWAMTEGRRWLSDRGVI